MNWLEGHLRDYPGAILIVTHDRYFLDNVTGWILELDHGRGIPYEGNYTSWLAQTEAPIEPEGREDEARRRTLEREQEWVQSSPKARGNRQARPKGALPALRGPLEDRQRQAEPGGADHHCRGRAARRQNVVDFDHLTKGFGNNLLIDDLTFELPAGGIVGVIGPNGAGKTTLFRMITGAEKPDTGTIKRSASWCISATLINCAIYSRLRTTSGRKSPEGNDIVLLGKREINDAAYCASFNFKGADQQKKVGSLSGGERNRLHLAKSSHSAVMCYCSTNRPTISTSIRCARWKRRSRISPAAP